ncbi:MAG: cytochrome c peroxidase [Rhodospirillaceae bacterium]|nr:cytochrome c peroxidase [Rhodospirillaceae bacterium]
MTRMTVLAMTAALVASTAAWAQSDAAPDPALVARGKALFEDPSLSGDGKTSCATCHPGSHTDNKSYVGLNVVPDGDPNGRSTPTMWGAAKRSVYAWAGTAPTMSGNIRGIIVNRMKGAEPAPETLAALVAYIGTLEPPRSGHVDEDGLPTDTAPEAVKRGFELFTGEGQCGTCHVMPTFDKPEVEDVGSGGTFKVPALWAVAQTAPYYHDGRYKTLEETAKYMWEFQTKKAGTPSTPTPAQLSDLVAYLKAL